LPKFLKRGTSAQLLMSHEGILLVNKPPGLTSFSVVAKLRKRLGVKKIGHAGTLDPFATGLLVILVGRNFTRIASKFLHGDKHYRTTFELGKETDSYDVDGKVTATSSKEPTLAEIEEALQKFQGAMEQTPPMFSAKKVGGKKLYELARKGIVIERLPTKVFVLPKLLDYHYPNLSLDIICSKGTYVRSYAQDLGRYLGSYAFVKELCRTRSAPFSLEASQPLDVLLDPNFDIEKSFITKTDENIS